MESISTNINKFKYRRPVNSKRAYVIEQVILFMGEKDNSRFGYWCGRTKKVSPDRLFELMSESKQGKNPRALFQWKLKHEVPKQVALF